MTRPRARCNAEGVTGFSVADPGGNPLTAAERDRLSVVFDIARDLDAALSPD